MKAIDKILKSKAINLLTKPSIVNTYVFSNMLFGCETWIITRLKDSKRRILTFERKCYTNILRIGWMQKITIEELYQNVQLKENLLYKVIKRKLRLIRYTCRMSNDTKIQIIVFGMIEDSKGRGRLHREWTDDINEW